MILHNEKKEDEKPLTSVMEDYLETIFDLDKEKRVVRVKDIAKRMNVKMPTVSSMLKTLKNNGLIHYERYEYVELTKSGAAVGKEMRRRHEALRRFLTEILRIEGTVADEEACKMEHILSASTLATLTDFMEFVQICPRTGESWLRYFEEYRQQGCDPDKCRKNGAAFSCEFRSQIDLGDNEDNEG